MPPKRANWKIGAILIGVCTTNCFRSHARAEDNEQAFVDLGSISVGQNGMEIQASLKGKVDVDPDGKPVVKVYVISNLGNVQQQLESIVQSIPLPSQSCRTYGANNQVISLKSKELASSGDNATLSLDGYVTQWQCIRNPSPNSRVDWTVHDLGFGVKTKIPQITTWEGTPIKTIVGSKSISGNFQISWDSQNKGDPVVISNLSGGIDRLLSASDVNDAKQKMKSVLELVLIPNIAIARLSPFNPVFDSGRFSGTGSEFSSQVVLSTTATPSQIEDLKMALQAK